MKLAIFNGSPRGINSNTKTLLDFFQKGFENAGGEIELVEYLIKEKQLEEQVQHFEKSKNILLAFPLYVDSVPGVVKQFIETIGDFNGSDVNISFIVHSGFPEGIHSDGLVRYLELLTKRWKMNYMGTLLKPGSEQVRMQPKKKNTKLFQDFENLGKNFALTGTFDEDILTRLKQPYVFPTRAIPVIRLMSKLGLIDLMWNREFKKNKAYKNRFDKPLLRE
ncbi:NAD(P)H-dependent oxidoreductase [Prolixibacteraceae bacterium Z1-6]|uniref:NAD(P)H-dependent oxidoreductase n=1 Tax=Draconibacterium aestuarii TaxID=2998507 RepID=A0A9X3F2Z0_9BACT|nr:NAD(P)H-dependent oxidoreductase [Prolixibacteraceae bacterium Z1-6]